MAYAGRAKAGGNPFFEDDTDDVDDFTFLSRAKQNSAGATFGGQQNLVNNQREQLLQERRQLEDSILQGSNSAVRVLYDTEEVGIATAEVVDSKIYSDRRSYFYLAI